MCTSRSLYWGEGLLLHCLPEPMWSEQTLVAGGEAPHPQETLGKGSTILINALLGGHAPTSHQGRSGERKEKQNRQVWLTAGRVTLILTRAAITCSWGLLVSRFGWGVSRASFWPSWKEVEIQLPLHHVVWGHHVNIWPLVNQIMNL